MKLGLNLNELLIQQTSFEVDQQPNTATFPSPLWGVTFRRQVVIGQAIVDFCASQLGSSSRSMAAATTPRASWRTAHVSSARVVRATGCCVLPASLVMAQPGEAVGQVVVALWE